MTLLELGNFKLHCFKIYAVLKTFKKIEIIFCKRVPSFLLREWNHSEKKVVEEHCWAITQRAGRSNSDSSGSSTLEFTLQMDTTLSTYIWRHL
jgi:hypothetical protein